MGNKTPSSKTPVANPGPAGVFLFPNASTFNVPAFTPFPSVLRRSTSVGHVFPFPFSVPAVLAGFRSFPGRPTLARKPQDQKTGVDPFPADVRFDPFPAVLRRPRIPSGRFPTPGRPRSVLAVLSPFMRSTPTVDPLANPGRRSPTAVDDPRRRSDGRTTTSTPVGRRKARNRNGGLRIKG